jgi:fibronectin type 3 domain-containing protein
MRLTAVLVVAWMVLAALPTSGGDTSVAPLGSDDGEVGPAGAYVPGADSQGRFTENMGQWEPHVRFMAWTSFGHMVLGTDGATYDVRTASGGHRVKVAFEASDPVEPEGLEPLETYSNYIYGPDPASWVAGAMSYREVLYRDVWPGVDVRYHFQGNDLKYDIIVGPMADPSPVGFTVKGAEGLDVGDDRLDIRLSRDLTLQDRDLVAYYQGGEVVDVAFRGQGRDGYGFEVDKSEGRTLVIDPLVLPASTFLGGSYADESHDLELDAEGNVYVAGTTSSMDFPVTEGAYSETLQLSDVVITKMDRDLTEVQWCTFIGGSAEDLVEGIELDPEGNVFVLGETKSTDLPVTAGAPQQTHGNQYTRDVFVLKLSSDGTSVDYCTYLGGRFDEVPGDLKVHEGRAYVALRADSDDFPFGSFYARTYGGQAVLLIINEDGTQVDSVMHWGGSRSSEPKAISVDAEGNVTVSGLTAAWDFPTTPGAYMEEGNYNFRSFLLRCDPEANETIFATYFGVGYVTVSEMALDGEGNIYLVGGTLNVSALDGLPLTEGAYCTTFKGRSDSFITKMDPKGTRIIYSTLVGSNGDDVMNDMELTADGNVVIVGHLRDGGGYDLSDGCLDPVAEGTYEGFVFILNDNGSERVHATFMGGPFRDHVTAVEVTAEDTLMLTGHTESKGFPVTEGAFQTELAGDIDMFVSELACLYPPSAPLGLKASGGEGNITLEWEPPADDGGFPISNYSIFKGTQEDELSLLVEAGNGTTFQDLDVEWGVTYRYVVMAFNGRGISPFSNVASARSVTVPDPPTNLTGTVHKNHIGLEWDFPDFTGGLPLLEYRLYRGTSPDIMVLHARISDMLWSFADTQIERRTTYIYQLAVANSYGESRTRAELTLRTTGVPTVPQNLTHTYGDRFIRLAWEVPEDEWGMPIQRYNVYRYNDTGPGDLVGSVAPPTLWFRDKMVEFGIEYHYTVTAMNGQGESDASPELVAMTMRRPFPPSEAAASALEDFVRVTWTPPEFDGASPVTGYRVYHGATPEDAVYLGGVPVIGSSVPLVFLHGVAYDGVLRQYYVTAVNAEGESDPSLVATTTPLEVPGMPRDLTADWGDERVTLDWLPPEVNGGAAVVSYTLYRKVAGDVIFTELAELTAGNPHYVDDTVTNGVDYQYRVAATNLAGEGAPSLTVTATPAGPPLPPIGLLAEGMIGTARVTWDPPMSSGGRAIDGYRVYGVSDGLQLELLAEVGPDVVEYVHEDLANGGVYLYALRAFSVVGESELSVIVEARPAGPPQEVQGLVAFWSDGQVYLTWSSPVDIGGSPITGYFVHRDDREPGNWTEVSPLQTTYQDHEVEAGLTYNYTVYALNDVDRGPEARANITIPVEVEAPPETDDTGAWPYLAMGMVAVAAVATLLAVRSRPRGVRDDHDDEVGPETEDKPDNGEDLDIEDDLDAEEDVVIGEDEALDDDDGLGDDQDVEDDPDDDGDVNTDEADGVADADEPERGREQD